LGYRRPGRECGNLSPCLHRDNEAQESEDNPYWSAGEKIAALEFSGRHWLG
jgi:hypothetical protein